MDFFSLVWRAHGVYDDIPAVNTRQYRVSLPLGKGIEVKKIPWTSHFA
jgi:hypothetical protein